MTSYETIGEGESGCVRKAPCCRTFEPFGGPVEKAGSIPAFYRKLSIGIICFWLCLSPIMAIFAPQLQGETSLEFDAPSGHQSDRAQTAMNEHWAATEASSIIVMVITAHNGVLIGPYSSTTKGPVQVFIEDMTHRVNATSYVDELTMSFADYYSLSAVHSSLAGQLISEKRTATVMTFTLLTPGSTSDGSPYVSFVDYLRDTIDDLSEGNFSQNYDAAITGQKVLQIDARKGTIKDASKADMIVIPIAFAILACFLKSWRLMLLPLITIGVCIGTGFAAAYPIACAMKVQSTTPQLMMSATLALNIDYNLFLLMRFRENHDLGFGLFENLHLMITHTALETVLGSGSLVSLAFFAMAIIPCEALVSTGICCGITIAIVVAVNITLTPSILAIFGTFFAVPAELPKCISARFAKAEEPATLQLGEGIQDDEATGMKEQKAQSKSFWFRVGKQIQRAPAVVVVVIVFLFAFLYIRFPDLETSLDPFTFVPRNADSAKTWRTMAANGFPPGAFQQYYYVITSNSDDLRFNETEGFAVMLNLSSEVAYNTMINDNTGGFPYRYVVGPTSVPVYFSPDNLTEIFGKPTAEGWLPPFGCCTEDDGCAACPVATDDVTVWTGDEYDFETCWFEMPASRDPSCKLDDSTVLPAIMQQAILLQYSQGTLSPLMVVAAQVVALYSYKQLAVDGSAAYFRVLTPFEPTGKPASTWMDEMADLMDSQVERFPQVSVYLAGGNTIPYDFGKIVDAHMYIMLAILVCVVFVIVALLFRSVAIPIIMAFTIVYSTGSAFGMAYYFFQTTAFSWIYPYLDNDFKDEGVAWSVPPMAISITVALAIDYDIFMLTRIAELRKTYTNEAAILKGLYCVGSTICGAGVIMSVAFGGLLFSHVVSLNQFSVILVTSVLLDTFLLSTIFVPACAFLLGDKFWWPMAGKAGVEDEWHFESNARHCGTPLAEDRLALNADTPVYGTGN